MGPINIKMYLCPLKLRDSSEVCQSSDEESAAFCRLGWINKLYGKNALTDTIIIF